MIDYRTELIKQKEELFKKQKQYIRLFDKLSYQQNLVFINDISLLQSNIRTLERKVKSLRLKAGDSQ